MNLLNFNTNNNNYCKLTKILVFLIYVPLKSIKILEYISSKLPLKDTKYISNFESNITIFKRYNSNLFIFFKIN